MKYLTISYSVYLLILNCEDIQSVVILPTFIKEMIKAWLLLIKLLKAYVIGWIILY